ncbi:MAG: hypothetical protein RR502_04180 [Oscillospiraceae bacterium]
MATIHILIILAVFIGIIFLQIFLSKKENRLLGLILPIITFLCSLLALLNAAAFPSMTAWEVFGVLAATFILSNIPTLILLAIYCACKGKSKRKKQLEKMNIQDLD